MTGAELRAALNAYMHRTDPETVANEPVALELARVKLSRTFFPEPAAVSVELFFVDRGDGTAGYPAPPDMGQADTLYVSGRGDLEYLTPREFTRRWAEGNLAGVYTVTGSPTGGGVLLAAPSVVGVKTTFLYFKVPDAVVGIETGWCSQEFPDVWLWQAIAEQHRFVQDFESAGMADGYAAELATVAMVQTRANVEGGVLRMTGR